MAKLMLSQARLDKHKLLQSELEKELEHEKLRSKGVSEKDISMKEMREELEKVYKEEA